MWVFFLKTGACPSELLLAQSRSNVCFFYRMYIVEASTASYPSLHTENDPFIEAATHKTLHTGVRVLT